MRVTIYEDPAYYWKLDIDPDKYPNTKFYIPSKEYTNVIENGDLRVHGILNFKNRDMDIEIYSFGEAAGVPQMKFYSHTSWTGGVSEEVNGTSKVIASEKVNFTDFILENYDENSGISRLDWYNATVQYLQLATQDNSFMYFARFDKDYDYHRYFMSWYYYDITIDAGERIVNSVTAPMYPGTNINYKPPKYDYTYLLSPAATWKDFGDLDIIINTPYYMTYSSIDGFEKTESGYKLHLDGLPIEKGKYKLTLNGLEKEDDKVKDLVFKLSTSESPQSKNKLTPLQTILVVILIIILLPIAIIGGLIYGIICLVRLAKNKSK